jgi:hypothetical protein
MHPRYEHTNYASGKVRAGASYQGPLQIGQPSFFSGQYCCELARASAKAVNLELPSRGIVGISARIKSGITPPLLAMYSKDEFISMLASNRNSRV